LRFIWDYDNLTHIARHDVSSVEVEEALSGETVPIEYQDWHSEERFAEVGMTSTGRILTTIYTWRDDGIRVVTSYESSRLEVRAYLDSR
jgi:uncharacterized DUF497 family protein